MADVADEDSLVHRRSRRPTAGNRMEEALAEMAALHPDPEMEADDDKDFLDPKEEDEIFDSDFQSTDEDVQDEDAAADNEIIAEERQARKSAHQRTLRAVEARTDASGSTSRIVANSGLLTNPKRKVGPAMRRVSVGGAVDAETGEALSKRKSRRQSTVLSSQILNSRLKDAEERKALMPKRTKEVSVTYTQAELLAHALDTEEGNIVSHRNYLEEEEEKRKRARVVRRKLTGHILSWVSRLEDEIIPVDVPYLLSSTIHGYSDKGSQMGSGILDASRHTGTSEQLGYQNHGAAPLPSSYFAPSAALHALSQPQSQPTSAKTERVNKNYLVHRVDESAFKPDWSETMATVFGPHVNWEEVKVYSGKHRPFSRPVNTCSITGRTAVYRDPRSGVPFANVDAYGILSRLLTHEYVWNDELRCYTADERAAQLEPELDEATDALPMPALPTN